MSSTNAITETNRSLDATLDALSHATRRYVLWYLDRESEAVPVETLAAAIAARRTDDERSEPDPDARRRAHASLRHAHLPRLESAGLIERTRGSGGATLGAERSESADSDAEYVEAATDGTPVEAFLDEGFLGAFEADDRP